jgi:chaperone required for assembly of F1-ATPase
MQTKVYHIKHGEADMYQVDAAAAVRNFPEEWSTNPWPSKEEAKADADAAAAKAKAEADAKAKADADAKAGKTG